MASSPNWPEIKSLPVPEPHSQGTPKTGATTDSHVDCVEHNSGGWEEGINTMWWCPLEVCRVQLARMISHLHLTPKSA